MRHFALLLLLATPALAHGWTPLTGEEIRAALSGRALVYGENARQEFYASGRTLYEAPQPSWGRWSVRGDQYCSQWPPSDLWTCYGMARHGDELRFIDASGEISDGTYDD